MKLDKRSCIEKISEVLEFLKLTDAATASEKLYEYLFILFQQNQVMNLVSVNSMDELIQTHLYDSLIPVQFFPELINKAHCLKAMDIGSGGGFPAIPMSIVSQNSQWIMVESIQKKANFLRKVVRALTLCDTIIIPFRVEEFIKTCPIPPLHLVTIRAVGKIEVIYPYIQVFRRRHIPIVLWKHPDELDKFNEKQKEPLLYEDHPYPVNNGSKHILLIR